MQEAIIDEDITTPNKEEAITEEVKSDETPEGLAEELEVVSNEASSNVIKTDSKIRFLNGGRKR